MIANVFGTILGCLGVFLLFKGIAEEDKDTVFIGCIFLLIYVLLLAITLYYKQ